MPSKTKMTETSRPIGVDLFCGAGGMSLGFQQAGFDVAAAVDSDPIHVSIHSKNFPTCRTIQADLSKVSGQELRDEAKLEDRQIDVLFGGPPCGGFSIMGKRNPDDARNDLLRHFARLTEELHPHYFVIENVEGLVMKPMMQYLKAFEQHVRAAGYAIVQPIRVLDASDFGVPQRRKRVFILGYQEDQPKPEYPVSPGRGTCPTVWDAIGDLPNVDDFEYLLYDDVYRGELSPALSRYVRLLRGEVKDPQDLFFHHRSNGEALTGCARTDHTDKVTRRFESTEPGTREPISKFYRLTKQGVAPTLRAGTDSSRGSYSAARPIHPIQPRCITVREGARLHSFPDWFDFHETKWHGFRQIGNSVPPFLARAIGHQIRKSLAKKKK